MKKNSLLILLSLLFISSVYALEAAPEVEYRVDDIRAYLVGGYEYDKELDYNKDGVIDILDLVETKDMDNVHLEEKKQIGTGFGDIDHRKDDLTTTTTTRKVSSIRTVSRTSSNRNTTRRETTTRGTTTRRASTTRRSTTSRTTTTRTTTAPKKQYTISVKVINGSVDSTSKSVKEGGRATFKITPNTNYKYSKTTCQNGTKTSVGSTSITFNSVNQNDVCTIEFQLPSVVVNVKTYPTNSGSVGKNQLSGRTGDIEETTVVPATGYKYSSVSCGTGLPAEYNESTNVLRVTMNRSGTCTVKFVKKTYKMTIMDNTGKVIKTQSMSYKEGAYAFQVSSTAKFNSLTCNGESVSFTKRSNTYKFNVVLRSDTTCTFN